MALSKEDLEKAKKAITVLGSIAQSSGSNSSGPTGKLFTTVSYNYVGILLVIEQDDEQQSKRTKGKALL